MIVRILGEGQYDVPGDALDTLNKLDAAVASAVDGGDEATFAAALGALLDSVRAVAQPHFVESLDISDVILPAADSSLAEVRELLSDDGLIPG